MMVENEKKILGLTEVIHVCGNNKCAQIAAICDTGATRTSVDSSIAKELDFGKPIRETHVKNPSIATSFKRIVVKVNIEIAGIKFEVEANIQDRQHMTHKMIIGRDVLFGHFIVDVSKTHDTNMLKAIKDKDLLAVRIYDK